MWAVKDDLTGRQDGVTNPCQFSVSSIIEGDVATQNTDMVRDGFYTYNRPCQA